MGRGEGTNDKERIMRFSFSTPKETSRGLKHERESKMGTNSSERITKDVDLALKALGLVFPTNGSAV